MIIDYNQLSCVTMQNIIEIECPTELLIGLNTNAEDMVQLVRREAALGLFRDGRISFGMASRWQAGNSTGYFFNGYHAAIRHTRRFAQS